MSIRKESINQSITEEILEKNAMSLQYPDKTTTSFNEENLICTALDLFFAGTETTSTALRWALLYITVNPEVQGEHVLGEPRKGIIVYLNIFTYMWPEDRTVEQKTWKSCETVALESRHGLHMPYQDYDESQVHTLQSRIEGAAILGLNR